MAVVDFLIAGVQKCGTTALHHFLSQHPDLYLPPNKELHFFDNETVDWSTPDYGIYEQNFAGAGKCRLRGEATPIYTYWRPSLERIARYNPDIRLIVTLRDPVDRAFSQWKMETRRGLETMGFSEAIRSGRRRVEEDKASLYGCHRVYSYVERGFYADQVARMLSHFPADSLLFLTSDALNASFQGELDRITDFLGVDRFSAPEYYSVSPTVPARAVPASMHPGDERYLRSLFSSDIRQTESLTGLDLSAWRLP